MHECEEGNRPLLAVVTGVPGSGKSTVADIAADLLGASVLGHDWAMSGLRPFSTVQDTLDAMEPPGHGPVGWSIIRSLARSQLRRGRSVVLDGVARPADIEHCVQLARAENAKLVVILVECPDPVIHRSRIEGRDRAIPDWYELTWDEVQGSLARWTAPDHVDLRLDSTEPEESVREHLDIHLARE
jgi:predicted kinase